MMRVAAEYPSGELHGWIDGKDANEHDLRCVTTDGLPRGTPRWGACPKTRRFVAPVPQESRDSTQSCSTRFAAGEIHLAALLLLGPHVTEENHRQVLERAKHRTMKEVARLVRMLDPLPDVAPVVSMTSRTGEELRPLNRISVFAAARTTRWRPRRTSGVRSWP
jgi:hypothetical protein